MKKVMLLIGMLGILVGCSTKENVEKQNTKQIAEKSTTTSTLKSSISENSSEESSTTESSKEEEKITNQEHENKHMFYPYVAEGEVDEPVRYESDGERMTAYLPDYSHYDQEDVKQILGEPREVITDKAKIQEMLEGQEWQLAKEEYQAEKLSETQAKAFMFSASDVSIASGIGMNIEAWLYDDGKPNVYIGDNEVVYVTPKVDYIDFAGKLAQ